jgi:hypothetical protein
LGSGIDNNQAFISMGATSGNIVNDEKNGVIIASTTSVSEIGQYFPQGLALYTHINNPVNALTGTGDNAGRCAHLPCTITFSIPYKNKPICVATDETSNSPVRPQPAANGQSVSFLGSSSDSIAYHCVGFPN